MILDNDFPPDPRVENEARILIEAGMEVHLFAFSYSKDFVQQEIYKGIQVHRFYCSKLLYKLSALAYTFPFYHILLKKRIEKFIRTVGCDVVHIHDVQVARAVFMIKSKFNFKVVLDLHENRPEIMKFYKHVRSFPLKFLIYPLIWKKREEEYISKSDGVVVVTKHAKEEIVNRTEIAQDKIVVAPNVVEEDYASSQSIDRAIVDRYQDDFVLLYLGDTSERRGLITAVKAVEQLKNTIENIKLVVVGKSSFDNQLAQLVASLKITNQVDFLGWQQSDLFPSFIAASAICISPLERNIHHDTTYANKLFQYMALGGVLLVSDCIAQESLVKETETGLVFKDKSVGDFVLKTLELYNDEAKRSKCAAQGKLAIAQKYYWNKTGQELVEYYKKRLIS